MSLSNTLQQWITDDSNSVNQTLGMLQPFSHIASTPEEVDDWVPVVFDELYGPMDMDQRSMEALKDKLKDNKSMTIHYVHNGPRSFVRCIDYEPDGSFAPAVATTMDDNSNSNTAQHVEIGYGPKSLTPEFCRTLGAYSRVLDQIAVAARQHDFYAKRIEDLATRMRGAGSPGQILCPGVNIVHYHDQRIWALCNEGPDYVEINYVFVFPDVRRQGHFRRFVAQLAQKGKRLCACTISDVMIQALTTLGFVVSPNQFGGRSDGSVAYIKKPTKPKPNAPCPCGSGAKYKKCCR